MELFEKFITKVDKTDSCWNWTASVVKSGITSMPVHIQKMLIRTSYYPTPDRNEEILAYLLQHNVIKPTSAILLNPSKILDELVIAEHVIKKGKKYYLSDMGTITAKGTMSLYPELIQK